MSKRFWKLAMHATCGTGFLLALVGSVEGWLIFMALGFICYRQVVRHIDREFYEAVERLRGTTERNGTL